jgi:hypothetical protein
MPVAAEPPTVQFEAVPVEKARRLGHGPRLEPRLYATLRQKIQCAQEH